VALGSPAWDDRKGKSMGPTKKKKSTEKKPESVAPPTRTLTKRKKCEKKKKNGISRSVKRRERTKGRDFGKERSSRTKSLRDLDIRERKTRGHSHVSTRGEKALRKRERGKKRKKLFP